MGAPGKMTIGGCKGLHREHSGRRPGLYRLRRPGGSTEAAGQNERP
eukprot:Gb_07505 [translate_table: standard]